MSDPAQYSSIEVSKLVRPIAEGVMDVERTVSVRFQLCVVPVFQLTSFHQNLVAYFEWSRFHCCVVLFLLPSLCPLHICGSDSAVTIESGEDVVNTLFNRF